MDRYILKEIFVRMYKFLFLGFSLSGEEIKWTNWGLNPGPPVIQYGALTTKCKEYTYTQWVTTGHYRTLTRPIINGVLNDSCHDLIILISNWYLPITYHFRKITLRNHLRTTHRPLHPNSSIHDTNQNITSSLSDDQILLNSDSLTSCHNRSMALLGLCAITIPIFSRGIFGQKCPLPTLEFTR